MNLRFPIRFKLMSILLLVITLVVSIITYTMAALFHTDKTTYIYDMTSIIAQHVAEESYSLHLGYEEKLSLFSRIMIDSGLPQNEKNILLQRLFEDIGEFVSVSLYENGKEQVTIYDSDSLTKAGLSREELSNYRQSNPLPGDKVIDEEGYIVNSTLNESLPTLTIAILIKSPETGNSHIVSAMVRMERLLNVVNRSSVFETFLMDNKGSILAHKDLNLIVAHTIVDWIPLEAREKLKVLTDMQSTATIVEYVVKGEPVVAGYARARVKHGSLIAGVQVPKSAAYLTARELLGNLLWVALGLLILAALLGIIWAQRITRPIERLSEAAKAVGQGGFDIRLDVESRDELGALASSFNTMTTELHSREVALESAQSALVQSEKMAAFGQLGAGIAHEIKNPLAGILGYAQLSKRKVEKDGPVYNNLVVIEKETKRCKDIIENLMKFARKEDVKKEPTDVNLIIEETIAIVDHQLSVNQVKIVKVLDNQVPEIYADGNQIKQALINFMINAQQAMDGVPGEVRISSCLLVSGRVEVRVADSGPGMTDEVKARVFEPFFTTKAAGKGTGLGLSVTFGIIRDHQGTVEIESEPGKGAAFIVTLPAYDEQSVYLGESVTA